MAGGELVGLLVIGFIAGIMSGMFGIGGGAIIVPSLVIFLGYTQTKANGTSLAALLLPVAIFAVISYYRAGKLKLWIAGACAIGLLLGTGFGAIFALGLDKKMLSVLYGIFLFYMSWRNLAPRQWWREYQGILPEPAKAKIIEEKDPRVLIVSLLTGILAGVLAGMFGIGGGVIIVAVLTSWLAFDQQLANGTSLAALLLPVGLPAVVAYGKAGDIDLSVVLPMVIMLAGGSIVGAKVALGLPAKTVRRLYGVFLLVVGFRFLFF